jgi:hypothetical protein
MNHLKYIDQLINETVVNLISAKVKDIEVGTPAFFSDTDHKTNEFTYPHKKYVGKILEFLRMANWPDWYKYYDGYGSMYFHKSWLELEPEGTPQNLFPGD